MHPLRQQAVRQIADVVCQRRQARGIVGARDGLR